VKLKSFTELTVWQRAHELALSVFRLTEKFPRSEQFGIVAQVRRSSASVTANIAEGFGRGHDKGIIEITSNCQR
jgi:four helix bundle protein